MARITLKEAKRLSILKWEWIINNGGGGADYDHEELIKAIPELSNCLFQCGFCQYAETIGGEVPDCETCPLFQNEWKKSNVCAVSCIPQFDMWLNVAYYKEGWDNVNPNQRIELATAVLDAIKDVPDE